MIYTVTLNPSLDYNVTLDEISVGQLNTTTSEQILPGGKGINVSMLLKNLGIPSTVFGFIGGFTGEELERRLKEHGCKTDFIKIQDGITRINIKLKMNLETEINGQGPQITKYYIDELFFKLKKIEQDDILVLSGSIPSTMSENIYEEILEKVAKTNCKVVLDTRGDLVARTLKYRPFLIKPNHHELSDIFQKGIYTKEEFIESALKLKDMGARNVLISRAGEGAILLSENGEILESTAPKGKVINSVGAGDSMVAGFLAGYLEKQNYKDAFYMGIAAGSASAFSEELAKKHEIIKILKTIRKE